MTKKTDLHIKALNTGVELALISGVVALVSDIGWLLHDVVVNGMSFAYCFIGLGLVLALVIAVYALYKIHTSRVSKAWKVKVLKARKERAKQHEAIRKALPAVINL